MSILAIENSKVTPPDGKKRFLFLADLSCLHKSAFIDSFNTKLSDKCKYYVFCLEQQGWQSNFTEHVRSSHIYTYILGREFAN